MKSELPFHLKFGKSSNTNQQQLAGEGSSYRLDMTFTHLYLLLGVYSAKKGNPQRKKERELTNKSWWDTKKSYYDEKLNDQQKVQ